MRTLRVLALAASLCAVAPVARAEPDRPSRKHLLRHAAFTAVGGISYLVSETALKPSLVAVTCRWCQPPAFDGAIRDALHWHDAGTANTLSNITGYVIPPVLGLGGLLWAAHDRGDTGGFVDDGLAVLEAGVVVGLVNQPIKFLFGRQRPFVRYGDPARPHETDDNMSFYSGHTSISTGLAVAAGSIASRHHSKLAPYLWVGGLTCAAATGYLRIAADKHYASDVVTGAVTGALIGWLVPRWFHDHGGAHELAVVPMTGGAAVSGTF
jgi:membrane-associated phospholipid phosphatase